MRIDRNSTLAVIAAALLAACGTSREVSSSEGEGVINCTACHGDATRASNQAAPPVDSHGNTSTDAPGVGAHQAHLFGNATAPISTGVPCSSCHAPVSDLSHLTGYPAATDFSAGLGVADGATATYAGTGDKTCANYCHGATMLGGDQIAKWAPPTVLTCTSCHGMPPPSGKQTLVGGQPSGVTVHQFHAGFMDCFQCHGDTAGPLHTLSPAGLAKHVNGVKDVRFRTAANTADLPVVWDPVAGSCFSSAIGCHDTTTRTWRQ